MDYIDYNWIELIKNPNLCKKFKILASIKEKLLKFLNQTNQTKPNRNNWTRFDSVVQLGSYIYKPIGYDLDWFKGRTESTQTC